jgi:hypothetical protein
MNINDTKFDMTRDINGFNGFGLPFTITAKSGILAVGVAQSVVAPSGYSNYIAIFSYTHGANIWVDNITTAVAPTGAFSATTAELNPAARYVKAGSTISLITADITNPMVSISFYAAPPYIN